MVFESKELPSIEIKINGKIKNALDKYREKRIPMRVLLDNFLAVKSKKIIDAAPDNVWAYFYKGIEGHDVETGVSLEESAFRFGAMKIRDQNPSDVINAAFYANKIRNDSDFELGYLIPLFVENIDLNDRILIVNPSPDIVCKIEEICHRNERFYAVTDETVAKLYKFQFPGAEFYTFDQMNCIDGIDAALITNRDQNVKQALTLLNCLSCCNDNAKIIGLVPCAWLDNSGSGVYISIKKSGFAIKQLLIVDTKATSSSPRKKMIMLLEKNKSENIETFLSSYNEESRMFSVAEKSVSVEAVPYLESDKTILSSVKLEQAPFEEKKAPKYNKAEKYRFSEEISLFYRIYSGRKNKFAGVAFYREIKDIGLKTWGKTLSPDIEKGLRADTKDEVIAALEETAFDENIYQIIRNDISKKYIADKQTITLKTIWFYCWGFLSDRKKYNHEYVSELFKHSEIADIMPQVQSGEALIEAIAVSLKVNPNDIPYLAIEQIDEILKAAIKNGILIFDPLETYVQENTSRATERQQDVRNALVKKRFSLEEERKIFEAIVETKSVNGKNILNCTHKSLYLSVAIRLFTGIAIREVAALNWEDFRRIEGTDDYQFTITKFVDSKGNIFSLSKRESWKRFRIVPSAKALTYLLNDRRQYLLDKGIDEDYLQKCPIILCDERIADMKNEKKINHCRPDKISAISNELISIADIPENEIILPDEKNDLVTDFNRYHGDIFLSNFRHKANHYAYMTMGEINYMIGVNAPDTFSRHYCDYTNDFVQIGIIQKLSRWESDYEIMFTKTNFRKPGFGVMEGPGTLETGPFLNGVAAIDLIVKNEESADIKVTIKSVHGINVNKTIY